MIRGKQVLVTGGQFNQNTQISVVHNGSSVDPCHRKSRSVTDKQTAPIDVLTDAVAPNALHDSGASFDKPKCHPRTRAKIRDIILRWILGEGEDGRAGKQFMWLNGAAGCGKSAIAQSTVESCIECGLQLASFFFNRSDSTRNHAGSLVATLAYQLYCAFPETEVQTEILSAIKKDPLIFKKTIQQQFTSLIIRPLVTHYSKDQTIQQCVPFLIIIDGLDECTDRTAQKAILTGLAESVRDSNLHIPILVASRPEQDTKLSFSSKYLKDMHTNLSLDLQSEREAESDIRLYLFDRFAEIKDDFDSRTTGRNLARDWPGDKVIETLVWKSSRQFVYAATVIRYVESPRHRPDNRLDIILNHRPVKGDHPFAELDSLYTTILESALDIEKVLHVLSLYLVDSKICCPIIEKLLSYDEGEVETLFCDMSALIEIWEYKDQLYLRFLHASFEDYLLDAARSKQFHINKNHENIRHVTHALQYLAASCCSSSFDLDSIAGAPMWILYETQGCIDLNISQIPILLDLQQAVFSFPLKEFLEPHTSTRTFQGLPECFITPFLELMEIMVINNPTLSYKQEHQLGILRSVLMQQVQQYANDDKQALVLVLFYHLDSHRFVPVLRNMADDSLDRHCYLAPKLLYRGVTESNILSLSEIWRDSNCSWGDNVYHRFVRQLLRNTLAGQSAERALVGPIISAAAHCSAVTVKWILWRCK
ncbi:hypothetical protein CPC08DRAFT_318056 [Agrocybe pediades]|nr:hypothetical protein CPC08DRAFT_318056 [Agrocybe pediades]